MLLLQIQFLAGKVAAFIGGPWQAQALSRNQALIWCKKHSYFNNG